MKREDVIKDSSRLIIIAWCSNDDEYGRYSTTIHGTTDEEVRNRYDEMVKGYDDGDWGNKGYHFMLVEEKTINTILKEY